MAAYQASSPVRFGRPGKAVPEKAGDDPQAMHGFYMRSWVGCVCMWVLSTGPVQCPTAKQNRLPDYQAKKGQANLGFAVPGAMTAKTGRPAFQ